MNWKRRLREMMLAGGAVGLCVGYDEGCDSSGSVQPTSSPEQPDPCCNANNDPCCPVEECGYPMNPECQVEKDCQAAGGVEYWPFAKCVYEGGDGDATTLGFEDARSPPFFCCNGNSDPCCPFLSCDAGITQECQEELACIDAGRWDASVGACVAPSDEDASSATDAGAEAEASASDAAGEDASDSDAHD
jgi:hypothetical protein